MTTVYFCHLLLALGKVGLYWQGSDASLAQVAPIITRPPRSHIIVYNNTVNITLTCGVDNERSLTERSWIKTTNNNNKQKIQNNSTHLKFETIVYGKNATEEGIGYQCLVGNTFGKVLSPTATLTYAHFSVKAWIQPKNSITGYEENALIIRCTVPPDAKPKPRVKWYENNVEIIPNEESDSYKMLTSGNLFIPRVTARLSLHQYFCVVTNYLISFSLKSNVATLDVKPRSSAPLLMFTATPKNVTVTKGDKLDMECAVASNAAILIYSWSRPRKVGPSTAIWSSTGVQLDDDGCCYTCTVFFGNRTDTARLGHSSQAKVTVNVHPRITEFPHPTKFEVQKDKSIALRCYASGVPTPKITWYHDAEVVSHRNEHFIAIAKLSSSGVYQCFATNKIGEDYNTTSIVVVDTDVPSTAKTFLPSTHAQTSTPRSPFSTLSPFSTRSPFSTPTLVRTFDVSTSASTEPSTQKDFQANAASIKAIAGGAAGGVAFLVILILVIGLATRQRRQRRMHEERIITFDYQDKLELTNVEPSSRFKLPERQLSPTTRTILTEQADALKRFLIDSKDITLGEVIGEGAFGKVCKATVKDGYKIYDAAAKTLKRSQSSEKVIAFIEEGSMMADFSHPNVLGLLGICLDMSENRSPVILTPYMANGDLKNYLKKCRQEDKVIEELQLILFCYQIARGMKYISEKHYVHRDLAARNCMLDKDLQVKVADFGLARDIYTSDYYKLHQRAQTLPVKWMAPETLTDGKFTTQSDVWSFGVTAWEVFSMGIIPYPGLLNQEVFQYLKRGNLLQRPSLCPLEMWKVITPCWNISPLKRPLFSTIAESLGELAAGKAGYVPFGVSV